MDKEQKTPTWQWVAITAISLLLVLASILMNETRNDIREVRAQSALMMARITAVETSTTLQYAAIHERQREIKEALDKILLAERESAERIAKHIGGNR
jgi:hypothetical protein